MKPINNNERSSVAIIINAAPIKPNIAPEAPRLIEYNGNKNNENKFPIKPEMKYITRYSNLEK